MKILIRILMVVLVKVFYFSGIFFSFRLYSYIGGWVGFFAYYVVFPSRKLTLKNLKAAFPEYTSGKINTIARKSFVHQGRNLFEFFKFPSLNRAKIDKLVSFPDRKSLDTALAEGKGVLMISGHFGSWELNGAALAAFGYPMNVIAKKIYLESLNSLLVAVRAKVGIRVILRSQENAARDILKGLKRNEIIGLLMDQNIKVQGVFADFFGRKAYTPSGPAAMALRSGAAVVGSFLTRVNGKYYLKIVGPLEIIKTGDKEKDILVNTQNFNKVIENVIREHPDQWVWMHDRWKTR